MLINRKNNQLFLVGLFIFLLVVSCFSMTCGQINIPVKNTLAVIASHIGLPVSHSQFNAEQAAVIWFIRMPRMLVGVLVGAALGTSGAVMQGVFSNPLAGPGMIGVSAGAATGAVIAIALGFSAQNMFLLPAFAFAGSLFAIMLTVFLSMHNGKIPVMTLLLAGVAVGMFLSAVTSGILTIIDEQKLQNYLFWIIGGLDYRRWQHVYIAVGPIIIGIVMMILLSRQLNILVLGDTEARAVGMSVLPFRMIMLSLAAIVTAAAVCVSGNIGFVGLVVPHMMRMIIGPDHRILLPASALAGAIILVICDSLGRIIMPPTEIRVGIMTALLGTPYFLYLLRRMQKHYF
ncbi:FecCD family ABC transporter permease [Pectinatus sottacetonis]|uniref:FecCD family ABC transporter permease n=1 Tax=Pectinatus sottacetonis TaxID=1002795 RepID=UPI0018C7B03D|nr:iron ABC transporter permease [Pectinatus sottacetonis]